MKRKQILLLALLIAGIFAGGYVLKFISESYSRIEIENNQTLIGGCAGVYVNYQQECCDNWAKENEIVKVDCVGKWIIDENNSCSWKCNVE